MAATLPIEIVDQIVQSLAEDADSLAAFARATRLLRAPARPLLFRRIRLSSPAAPTVDSLLTHTARFEPEGMGYQGVWVTREELYDTIK